MKKINYHVTEQQLAFLKHTSEETGLSVAELIRRAIDAYFMHTTNSYHRGQQGQYEHICRPI